jgi:hypothetical protein
MMKKLIGGAVCLTGLSLSGLAMAQTSIPSSCYTTPGPIACYNWYQTNDPLFTSYGCNPPAVLMANHPECFPSAAPAPTPTPTPTPSPTTSCSGDSCATTADVATAHRMISGTSIQHALANAGALSARMLTLGEGGPATTASLKTGLAAGGPGAAWNVWANLTNTDSRYERSGFTADKSSGDVLNTVVGVDYRLGSNMVAGVSAAFDRGNGALGAASTSMSTEGYSIAPYIGYQFSKNLAVDASVGLGEGKFSSSGTTAESDRTFYALNLTYAQWFGNWQVTGKGNYISAVEKYGDLKLNGATVANSSSKNKLDQLRLGFQAGYWMNGMMPYVAVTYTDDVRRATAISNGSPWDRSAFLVSLGLNFFSLKSGVTGGIVYNQETNRANSDNESLMANISFRF